MKLIEEKITQLSTAHFTLNDNTLLEKESKADAEPLLHGIGVYENTFGFFLCLTDDVQVSGQFSKAFNNIIDMALSQNLSHIRFDCDAPVHDDLDSFEW